MKKSGYEKDFFKWTQDQTSLLRKKDLSHLDIDNLIEEIESLGINHKHSLYSFLKNLLLHLLKIQVQPEKHTKSWDRSVFNSRTEIKWLLKNSPSLKNYMNEILKDSYHDSRLKAALETKIDIEKFPKKCPWSIEEILGE